MDHLADAPVANLLILAGVVFLAVGLFGRIGGFIGSIFGNIEAGRSSRVLAGVLGLLLIAGGGWLHQQGDKSHTANPAPTLTNTATAPTTATTTASPSTTTTPTLSVKPASPLGGPSTTPPAAVVEGATKSSAPTTASERFVGFWAILIPRSDGIKRFEVAHVGQGLAMHIWYSCTPVDCDVGVHRLDAGEDSATVEFAKGSDRRVVVSLTLLTPTVLRLRTDIVEPGTSHRWQHHWIFTKSTLSEHMQRVFAEYLEAPTEKALAMAPRGWSSHFKDHSIDDAKKKALQSCEQHWGNGCRIVLLNNDAVE